MFTSKCWNLSRGKYRTALRNDSRSRFEGGNNENERVASPETVLINLNLERC